MRTARKQLQVLSVKFEFENGREHHKELLEAIWFLSFQLTNSALFWKLKVRERYNPIIQSRTAVFGERQLEELVAVIGDAVEVKALQSHVKEEMKPIANWVS